MHDLALYLDSRHKSTQMNFKLTSTNFHCNELSLTQLILILSIIVYNEILEFQLSGNFFGPSHPDKYDQGLNIIIVSDFI